MIDTWRSPTGAHLLHTHFCSRRSWRRGQRAAHRIVACGAMARSFHEKAAL